MSCLKVLWRSHWNGVLVLDGFSRPWKIHWKPPIFLSLKSMIDDKLVMLPRSNLQPVGSGNRLLCLEVGCKFCKCNFFHVRNSAGWAPCTWKLQPIPVPDSTGKKVRFLGQHRWFNFFQHVFLSFASLHQVLWERSWSFQRARPDRWSLKPCDFLCFFSTFFAPGTFVRCWNGNLLAEATVLLENGTRRPELSSYQPRMDQPSLFDWKNWRRFAIPASGLV